MRIYVGGRCTGLEISTIFGMAFGAACIIVSILLDGMLGDFLNAPSLFIVVGGVAASTFVSYPMSAIKSLAAIMKNAFKKNKVDLQADIAHIIRLADVARREGILALEEIAGATEDSFLKKGIMLVIDGTDPELIKSILETELVFIKERHTQGQAIMYSMSSYAPAYGMLGTLIGLINMLRQLEDPSTIGPNMAIALVTTFYGIVLANLVFTPIAKKLSVMSDAEYLRKELMLEGILSIHDGENPRIIREKLNAFLSTSQIKQSNSSRAAKRRLKSRRIPITKR